MPQWWPRPGASVARASGEPIITASAPQAIAVGDDVHVPAAGLVQVVAARGGHVRHGGRHRHLDAQHVPRGVRRAAAEADEHPGRAGPHQVQRRLVRGAAADDHRDVQLVDELLEVERLRPARDVLRRDRGAPDDEQVHPGVDDGLRELRRALRRQRGGRDDAGLTHLADALEDQLLPHRRGVDLLQAPVGLGLVQLPDLLEQRLRVVVPGPQPLKVEHAETAELADADRRLRGDHRVHRRGEERQLEAVGVDLPGDRHLLRVTRPPAGHHGDVVEGVGLPAALAAPDLDLSHVIPPGAPA
jgi:hypothetical protein